MRSRMTVVVVVCMVAMSGIAATAAGAQNQAEESSIEINDAAADAAAEDAAVTFSGGTSGGTTITVDEVTLPEGGFVTVHDASLGDGNVLGSVRGTSEYLEAGTHENVTVTLDEPLSEDATVFAMTHQDTNDDHSYDFVASNGQNDGPYTVDGDIVMQSANVTVSATVSASNITTNGGVIVVDRVELSQGGFVTIHDASLLDGAVFDSVRGTSTYLEAGVHENVRINLKSPVTRDTTLVPMAHKDTNGDETYDFVTSEGANDGPYANANGDVVVDTMAVTQSNTASATLANQSSGGERVVVEDVFVPKGGFVTIHDPSLQDGAVFDSVRGSSAKLSPGYHAEVEVSLDEPVSEDATLIAMPHKDTNQNDAYDFVTSEGANDGPYTQDGGAVVDSGMVSVSASVSMNDQSSNGNTVVVEDVDLSEGGFVTVHDSSLFAGDVFGSVRGSSEYLEAGHHERVTVTLDEPVRSTSTLVPMAHQDTNGDETYDFVTSEGADDGPYTANGGAVVDTARVTVQATVAASNQSNDGSTVTIDSVTLHDGGFVTIHDATILDGAVFDSVRGTSEYLEAGTHENVEVTLDESIEEGTTLIAMPHMDTDGDESYGFVSSEGAADGPYVADGGAVVAAADVSVAADDMDDDETTTMEDDETTTMMDDEETTMDDEETTMMDDQSADGEGGSPGFGVAVAVLALLGAALLARRKQ